MALLIIVITVSLVFNYSRNDMMKKIGIGSIRILKHSRQEFIRATLGKAVRTERRDTGTIQGSAYE